MTVDEVREQVEYLESTGIFKFKPIISHRCGYPVYDFSNEIEFIYLPLFNKYCFVKTGTAIVVPFENILQSESSYVQTKLIFHLDLFR